MNRIIQMQRRSKKPTMSYFMSRVGAIASDNGETYYTCQVQQTSERNILRPSTTFKAYINNFGIWASGKTIDECCEKLLAVKRPKKEPLIENVIIDTAEDLPF